jgi:hypothetical protein
MKTYKVIKEFGCAQKGDILHENEEGFFELGVECDCSDCYSSRFICISSDIAVTLESAGYLQELEEDEVTPTCPSEEKLEAVLAFIEEKIEQYTADHEALTAQYNEGDVPQCVKVEADTVYFNLIKVLNKIKNIINE